MDAERIDREIGNAAAWASRHQPTVRSGEPTTLEKYGIGWTMWDYAGGFGVVNKVNCEPTVDELVVKALGLHP